MSIPQKRPVPMMPSGLPVNHIKSVPASPVANPNVFSRTNDGESSYTTAGTFSFVVPARVRYISAVCIGVGGEGVGPQGAEGGAGGGLAFRNRIPVTPGETLTVVVDAAANGAATKAPVTAIKRGNTILVGASGGLGPRIPGRPLVGDGGGVGGMAITTAGGYGGGGGAGGYAGAGGGNAEWFDPTKGGSGGMVVEGEGTGTSGGGAAGGGSNTSRGGGGGGTGLNGNVAAGLGTTSGPFLGADPITSGTGGGSGGPGGADGANGARICCGGTFFQYGGNGGAYGGGGGFGADGSGSAGRGAVRIIWPGDARGFPFHAN